MMAREKIYSLSGPYIHVTNVRKNYNDWTITGKNQNVFVESSKINNSDVKQATPPSPPYIKWSHP